VRPCSLCIVRRGHQHVHRHDAVLGSWANTQKLASKEWSFELTIGTIHRRPALGAAARFTLGSTGGEGRHFLDDLSQADIKWLGAAFLGGVVFNLGNICCRAIDIAGMAVAFPVGVGLALVLGVITTYYLTGSATFRCWRRASAHRRGDRARRSRLRARHDKGTRVLSRALSFPSSRLVDGLVL